jgi:hypothetical protein
MIMRVLSWGHGWRKPLVSTREPGPSVSAEGGRGVPAMMTRLLETGPGNIVPQDEWLGPLWGENR